MKYNESLKRNKFTYDYEKGSMSMTVYYGGYEIDSAEGVPLRRVESVFKSIVDKHIKIARNKHEGSTEI